MAYRYEFGAAAARDLEKLCRHNTALVLAIFTEHVPVLLADPWAAGEKKTGNLAHVRAYGFKVKNVAYRLAYQIEDDVVTFIAIGTHDDAYARASRRR